MNIIFQTSRIIVREFSTDEEELYVGLYRDEHVMRYISKRGEEETRQKFKESVEMYRNGTGLGRWGIFNPADDDFMGFCNLMPNQTDHIKIEIGYVFCEKYWGRGLATELVKSLVDYGFNAKGLKEICACTDPQNIVSQTVLLKSGFKRDGHVFWHNRELPFFCILNHDLQS